MALINSIRFYQVLIGAGSVGIDDAARALVRASSGRLNQSGACKWLEKTNEQLNQAERIYFDVADVLQALANGQPLPLAVHESIRRSAREHALRMLKDPLPTTSSAFSPAPVEHNDDERPAER